MPTDAPPKQEPTTETRARQEAVKQFWEERHRTVDGPSQLDPVRYRTQQEPLERAFLRRIGKVEGQRVLDIGCGTGELSVYLASLGAQVLATDLSAPAIEKTRQLAQGSQVASRVEGRTINALEIDQLENSFDLAVGRFILHHIEPFDEFAEALSKTLKKGGRGVFLENNAANRPLMFAREHLTGRFGVPKYGDHKEHPLEPEEVEALQRQFENVHQHFDDFVCFRLLNTYLLRQKETYAPLMKLTRGLDRLVHQYLPPNVHHYSYHQIIEVQK